MRPIYGEWPPIVKRKGEIGGPKKVPRSSSGLMSMMIARVTSIVLVFFALAGCDAAELPEQETLGPNPTIPAPSEALIPAINVAPAGRWTEGKMPVPAPGLAVNAFAAGLDHPRWLYVLPNGDVLVAETNAPKKDAPSGWKD